MPHWNITWNHWHVDITVTWHSSFHNNKLNRKNVEVLYIKKYQPSPNFQEQSVELELLNWFYFLLHRFGNYTNFYVTVILVFTLTIVYGTWNPNISYFRCTQSEFFNKCCFLYLLNMLKRFIILFFIISHYAWNDNFENLSTFRDYRKLKKIQKRV